jgi:hypothetical protein
MKHASRSSRSLASHLLVLLAYGACTLLFTYPIAFEASAALPDHDPDVATAVWTQWWFRQAALGPERLHHTRYLFHPDGLDLTGHSHSPLSSALAALLVPVVGEIGAFNLSSLLVFPIGGWGMFLLARELTRRRGASFVAGLVWAFAPYHVTQALAHPSLASVEWLPFQVLFLRRALRGGGWRPAALAGLSTALTLASGLQLGLLAGLAAAAQLSAALLVRPEARTARVLRDVGIAALVATCLATPLVWPVFQGWSSRANPERLVIEERLTGQTDALAYLMPPRYHPLLGGLVQPVYQRFAKNRQWMPYLGLVPLSLASFAALRVRAARPWLVGGALLVVCALGARLRLAGAVLESVPLPYALVDGWTPLALLRSSDRFNLLVPLPLAAVVALALARHPRAWPAAVGAALVGFEYLCAPVPMARAYPDSTILTSLSDANDRTAILDLPMGRQASMRSMLLQTAHGRPLVEGMAARTPPEAYRFLRSLPLLRYLARRKAPDPPDRLGDLRRMAEAGVGLVVVHLGDAPNRDLERWLRVLDDLPSSKDEHFLVFDVRRLPRTHNRPESGPQ